MPEIIDKSEYDKGQLGCAMPHPDDIGHFAIKRIILPDSDPQRFAAQRLTQILEVAELDEEGSRTVKVVELSNNGRDVLSGEIALCLDGYGRIVDPNHSNQEKGYFIGDGELPDGELYMTMTSLLIPALREKIDQRPSKILTVDPPSQEEQDRYYG